MRILLSFILFILTGLVVSCGRTKPIVLEVDLYLHPEATAAEDLILQSAVRKRLGEEKLLRALGTQVRVVEGVVFLQGTVQSREQSDTAERLARDTEVTLNRGRIAIKDVRNHLIVKPD